MDQTKQDYHTLSSTQKKSLLKSALKYAKLGFAVFPCRPRRKDPDGLLVPNGHLDATTNVKVIRAWWTSSPNANIGIVPPEGYAVVDVDPRDGGLITLQGLGGGTETLKAFSGGPDRGHHLWYRYVPHQLPGNLGEGIQLKANGHGYVVAPPSIHPSGGIYEWEDEFNPELISPWPPALGVFKDCNINKVSEGITLTPSQIDALLKQTPSDDYDTWVKVGQGLKSDYPDTGFDWWLEWSKKSKKFPGVGALTKKWNSFKGSGVTTGTLVYLAGGKVPAPSPEEDFSAYTPDLFDDAPKKVKSGLLVTKLSQITAEQIEWLVPGYFARGMVHCIAGHGGAGKSLVVTSLMAALSQGVDWLTGEITNNPIDVLMITEEQLKISVKPRMDLAGANVDRIHIIEGKIQKKRDKGGKEVVIPWNLDDHIADTTQWLKANPQTKLLIIDPIGSFMEGDKREIDTWKDSNVRKVLDKWVKLAESLNIAIIYLAHFNKSKGSRAADKITGSSAFTTVTRMTYVVGQVGADWLETQGYPGNGDDRIMVGVKCNIGRKPPVLVIGVEGVQGNDNPRIFMKGALAHGIQDEAEQLLMGNDVSGKSVLEGGGTKETNVDKVFKVIQENPGITRRGIAGKLNIDEANVTQYVNKLIELDKTTKVKNGFETWNYIVGLGNLFVE
jgi:hypothetical protein